MVVSILIKQYRETGERCLDLHHILDKIRNRDGEGARQAMENHIQNMADVVKRFWAVEGHRLVPASKQPGPEKNFQEGSE